MRAAAACVSARGGVQEEIDHRTAIATLQTRVTRDPRNVVHLDLQGCGLGRVDLMPLTPFRSLESVKCVRAGAWEVVSRCACRCHVLFPLTGVVAH